MPHADPQDPISLVAGVIKRVIVEPPKPDAVMLERLGAFVDRWLKKHLVPLAPDTDLSLETWLAGTTYPEKRKTELREKWSAVVNPRDPKYFKCKTFMKDETYPEYKYPRSINSRTDEFKCAVGPVFKAIETEVYKIHHFIKHVPVRDRARTIYERLFGVGRRYFATDYTSFESLFRKIIMEKVEFKLYEYMTRSIDGGKDFMWFVRNVLGGTNECASKFFTFFVEATRMSGEMCTSLGNGFSNLMFMLFMLEEFSCEGDGYVEGDDGLFYVKGEKLPTAEDFAKLGLNIKLEVHDELSEASFCGLVFDLEEQINVTNPAAELVSFGMTTGFYANARFGNKMKLLRCKALSLAFQYPGCPIINSLARYGIRVTRGIKVNRFIAESKGFNEYERAELLKILKSEKRLPVVAVGFRTRLLVERLYGISVEKQQRIEAYLDGLSTLTPLGTDDILSLMSEIWFEYFDAYSTTVRPHSVVDEYPPGPWPSRGDIISSFPTKVRLRGANKTRAPD